MIKPQRLQKGDTVAVIAPASPPNQHNLKKGIEYLKEIGLNVVTGAHLYKKNGYLAGTDEQRAADIHAMFANKQVKAIICACGGYGTARLASQLNYDLIKRNPKIFWGYSDITFLHTAIHQRTGLVTFHGPMLSSDLGKEDVHIETKQAFYQLFSHRSLCYTDEISTLDTICEGEATGQLIGGNLTLLVSTLGTPFELDTKNKILFIEDIDEEPYEIDRMMTQLYMANKLQDAAGIIIGDFHNCYPKKRTESLSLEEALTSYLTSLKKPVMRGFRIGHCSPQTAVAIGSYVTMSTYERMVEFESGITLPKDKVER